MTTRDEYMKNLKTRLDHWSAEAKRWEDATAAAKEKQLEGFHQRREEAVYQLKLIENASTEAWKDLVKGADAAWERLQEATTQARAHFAKAKPAKTTP
jgi:hypothetical protein